MTTSDKIDLENLVTKYGVEGFLESLVKILADKSKSLADKTDNLFCIQDSETYLTYANGIGDLLIVNLKEVR